MCVAVGSLSGCTVVLVHGTLDVAEYIFGTPKCSSIARVTTLSWSIHLSVFKSKLL